MSPLATLWLGLGPALVAVLAALGADMLGGAPRMRSLVVGLLVVSGLAGVLSGWTADVALVHGALRTGGVFSTGVGIVMFGAALAIAVGGKGVRPGVTAALISLAAVGASVSFVSADLTSILIGLEITALCSYALVLTSGSPRSGEASMKYFVQGAVATGLFVLGMAVMLGIFAPDGLLTSIAAGIAASTGYSRAASLGFIVLVSAVAFKAGAAPFHSWAPDAYETAQAPTSAFLAGSIKLAMIGVLASLVAALAPAGASAQTPLGVLGLDVFLVLGSIAVVSIAVGSTIALMTRSYRRMLGYAGVAQVGYALIALAALNPSGAIVFGVTYAVATTAAFLAADEFLRLRPDWDGTVEGLTGLGRTSPALGAAVTVVLMSLAGIPPLLGFWGKLQAFGAGVQISVGLNSRGEGDLAVWIAAIVGVGIVGSVVSLAYYGSVVRALFSRPAEETVPEPVTDISSTDLPFRAVILLAALILVLGLMPVVLGIPMSVEGFLLAG